MSYYLAIAFGGALGAVSRYWLSTLVERHNAGLFPVGTLVVNVIGSLLIGVLFVVLTEKIQSAIVWRPLLVIGFLGAFTTFSTYSLDALLLMEQGLYGSAAGYVLASVVSCIFAAWLGVTLTRLLF